MAELQIIPKMVSRCLEDVSEPFLTSERVGADVSRILDHYRTTILNMDDRSLMSLCVDIVKVFGYDIDPGEVLPDRPFAILRRLPPGVELRGRAVAHLIVLNSELAVSTSGGSEVLDFWLDLEPSKRRSLTVGALSDLLLLLTVPSYVNEFLNTFRALPGLRQQLDELVSARLTWSRDELAEVIEAGYSLVGVRAT